MEEVSRPICIDGYSGKHNANMICFTIIPDGVVCINGEWRVITKNAIEKSKDQWIGKQMHVDHNKALTCGIVKNTFFNDNSIGYMDGDGNIIKTDANHNGLLMGIAELDLDKLKSYGVSIEKIKNNIPVSVGGSTGTSCTYTPIKKHTENEYRGDKAHLYTFIDEFNADEISLITGSGEKAPRYSEECEKVQNCVGGFVGNGSQDEKEARIDEIRGNIKKEEDDRFPKEIKVAGHPIKLDRIDGKYGYYVVQSSDADNFDFKLDSPNELVDICIVDNNDKYRDANEPEVYKIYVALKTADASKNKSKLLTTKDLSKMSATEKEQAKKQLVADAAFLAEQYIKELKSFFNVSVMGEKKDVEQTTEGEQNAIVDGHKYNNLMQFLDDKEEELTKAFTKKLPNINGLKWEEDNDTGNYEFWASAENKKLKINFVAFYNARRGTVEFYCYHDEKDVASTFSNDKSLALESVTTWEQDKMPIKMEPIIKMFEKAGERAGALWKQLEPKVSPYLKSENAVEDKKNDAKDETKNDNETDEDEENLKKCGNAVMEAIKNCFFKKKEIANSKKQTRNEESEEKEEKSEETPNKAGSRKTRNDGDKRTDEETEEAVCKNDVDALIKENEKMQNKIKNMEDEIAELKKDKEEANAKNSTKNDDKPETEKEKAEKKDKEEETQNSVSRGEWEKISTSQARFNQALQSSEMQGILNKYKR